MDELDLEKHRVKIIKGNKKNSLWLVVDNQYIMHCNDTSPDGSQYYWKCSHRRKTADCRYDQFHSKLSLNSSLRSNCGTEVDGDGNHHLTFLYQHDYHVCGQRVNGVLRQEFKNEIKEAMANDPRAKYGKVGIWIGNFECQNVYISIFLLNN